MAEKALISIVIPCLNEEKTIGDVIRQAQEGFTRAGYPYEIVVADNGSIDASRTISESAGARVVDVQKKGYGIALRTGIEAAHGTVVLFGDADLTYDFREGPTLVDELFKGSAGLVIGSRLRGTIEDGAMPLWHRYVGTPILTALIALLFGTTLSDSNSGFRAFRVQDFKNWRIHSDGMEICSEVIINCLRSGQTISEIPITLRASLKDRVPHLSTWRDGMRNLLIILSRAPQAFTYPGLLCVAASALVAIPSAMFGHITIGAFSLFEHHSMILAIMVGFIGSQSLIYGLLLDAPSEKPLAFNRYLLRINEVVLLKLLGLLIVLIAGFIIFIFTRWIQHHFNNINYLLPSLAVLYAAVVIGTLGFGIFIAQLQQNAPAKHG